MSGSQAWGSSNRRRSPRAFSFEGQRGLSAGAPQDWGKQKLGSQKEKRERVEKIFEEKKAENFPNMGKETVNHI